MSLEVWVNILEKSFARVLDTVLAVLPNLIVAIILLILGWIIGAALSKVIEQLFKSIKIDKILSATGLEELVNRTGVKLNSGKFIGELVKWFVIVVFLMTAFDILGLSQVNAFLGGVVAGYIPNVIAAVLILLVSVVLAEVLRKTVIASAKAAHLKSYNFLGSVTKWSIWIFALISALFQLGIAASIIQTLFTGVVVALALALGLSFGLGGRDVAQNYIEKMKREISDRE
jgi:small-conductance mechanosensitive channel